MKDALKLFEVQLHVVKSFQLLSYLLDWEMYVLSITKDLMQLLTISTVNSGASTRETRQRSTMSKKI